MFALDFAKLKLVLDFFEDNEPLYLTCILMKNNKGLTPIDLTIQNDSPKNASLMLSKLNTFGNEYSFSHLFFEHFTTMLEWNLPAFNEFLGNCFF